MDTSFLVKLLVEFLKDNIGDLKAQFIKWLREKAAKSPGEIDDNLVELLASLLGVPE